MGDIIEHKCFKCGGALKFDVTSQKVKCSYCDAEYEAADLMADEESKVELKDDINISADAGKEWDSNEQDSLTVYCCESCGGEVYSDENTSATMCPYCGNAVILKGRLSGTLKPDLVVPFKRTNKDAIDALKEKCKGNILVPKSFINENELKEIKGLYAPFWIYDADVDAEFKFIGVNERRVSNEDEEIIIKDYYSVLRAGNISYERVPVDGSKKLDDDLMESIEPFYHDDAVDFKTAYLSGYLADKYDVTQEEAIPRASQRISNETEVAFKETTHYDKITTKEKGVKIYNTTANYILYPVWLMNTQWKDQKFTFAMNGQTGKIVGNLPISNPKAIGLGVAMFFVIFGLCTGVFGAIMGGDYGTSAIIGFLFGVVATFFTIKFLIGQIRDVCSDDYASVYRKPNSFNLPRKSDRFMYRDRDVIRKK